MFLGIFLASVLILATLMINYCWIKPRKTMKFYQNQLRNMKYIPKIMPYKLFYNRFLAPNFEGKVVGDPLLQYKTDLPKYDIVLSNIMNIPLIEISHIDFLKQFFAVDKHYQYPKLNLLTKPYREIIGNNLFMSEGKIWKQKRMLLNKIFTFDLVKLQIPNILKICNRRIKQMEESCPKGQDQFGKYVGCYFFNDLSIKLFAQVTLNGFVGLKERQYIDGLQVSEYFMKIVDDINEFRVMSPTVVLGSWFYRWQFREIDKSINRRLKLMKSWASKVIQRQSDRILKQNQEVKEKIVIDNLFKAFVFYKKENNISEEALPNKDIIPQLFGFIFAGSDTTSNFLNGIICFVGKYPEVQQQLRKQINELMKDNDYSYENLKKFKYIDALQKQTIRFYGPAGRIFIKQAACDNYLNGLAIKKGTLIGPIFYGNHFSEKYFLEPLKFRPERWLNGECQNLDPYVLVGFSAGARGCIGKSLALLESKIALIKIMKRYKRIRLQKNDFRWDMKLFIFPQRFETKFTINQDQRLDQ